MRKVMLFWLNNCCGWPLELGRKENAVVRFGGFACGWQEASQSMASSDTIENERFAS